MPLVFFHVDDDPIFIILKHLGERGDLFDPVFCDQLVRREFSGLYLPAAPRTVRHKREDRPFVGHRAGMGRRLFGALRSDLYGDIPFGGLFGIQKTKPVMRRTLAIPISVAILYACSVGLNFYFQHGLVRTKQEKDVIERMFGGLRGVIGDVAFMKAEEYHHRGLPFLKALAYHEGESPFAGEEHHEEHAAGIVKKDLFSKIYSAVKVTEDSHLKPAEEKETLPWFYVEVAFNPNDIRGYVLGGYWLQRLSKFEESMRFMKEGLKNNPDSASISAAIGGLYLRMGKSGVAERYLEKARTLWIEGQFPNNAADKYSQSDRYFALDLLGDIYEKGKRYTEALKIYQEVYDIQPANAIIEKINRVKNLIK